MQTGQILYSSWGYDQTNIDFYEITKVAGKFVTLQKLAAETKEDRPLAMTGTVFPIKGKPQVYCQAGKEVPVEPIKRMVKQGSYGPYVKIESYASAWPWDGKPKGCSWYA